MIILSVNPLWQRDNRWASQRLGTVDGTTIGGYGCIITCMAMLATYYGHPITPESEDNWLTDNQGYIQGNLYRNDAFSREFKDCSFDKVISCTNVPAPLVIVDQYLNLKKPVVVMVDFDHDPNDGIQTHFVLIVGKGDNGHYICNDPWFGDQADFDNRYGQASKAINQVNLFSGPIPQPQSPLTTPGQDYSKKQAIIDAYQSLCNTNPTDDEVNFRLASNLNMVDIMNSICTGDSRFFEHWIQPQITQAVSKITVNSGIPTIITVPKEIPLSSINIPTPVSKPTLDIQGLFSRFINLLKIKSHE